MDDRGPRPLLEDADPPRPGIGRVAAQRVLPDESVADQHVDVRAGPPGRQITAVRRPQRQPDDALGEDRPAIDDDLDLRGHTPSIRRHPVNHQARPLSNGRPRRLSRPTRPPAKPSPIRFTWHPPNMPSSRQHPPGTATTRTKATNDNRRTIAAVNDHLNDGHQQQPRTQEPPLTTATPPPPTATVAQPLPTTAVQRRLINGSRVIAAVHDDLLAATNNNRRPTTAADNRQATATVNDHLNDGHQQRPPHSSRRQRQPYNDHQRQPPHSSHRQPPHAQWPVADGRLQQPPTTATARPPPATTAAQQPPTTTARAMARC